MIAYIVTEGQADADLLRTILPPALLRDVAFVPAGGYSGIKSLATSLVLRRRTPVAVVVDADSQVPRAIEERRQNIEEAIGWGASPTPFKVVLAVPHIEVVFLQAPHVLERVFGHPLSSETSTIARFSPKEALQQLFAQSQTVRNVPELLQALSPQDLEALRQAPFIQELSDFLRRAQELAQGKTSAAATA